MCPTEHSLLALLLSFCTSHPHSQLAYQSELLLTQFIELRSYPAPPSLNTALQMIYNTLCSLCSQPQPSDSVSLSAFINLATTIMQETTIVLPQLEDINPSLAQFFLQVTANSSLDIAALTMDMWLRLTVAIDKGFHFRNWMTFIVLS